MIYKNHIPSLATLGLAGALGILAACKAPLPPSPVAVEVAKPRLMSWRVASAHLEDIFVQIPKSSIEDFRAETPEDERKLVLFSHGEEGLKGNNAHVYGEPTPVTTDLMLSSVELGAQDVLYDLGCGRGYFLMQALLTTPLKKAVGIELAASRVNIGKTAHRMMLDQGLLPPGKVLELLEQDMGQANVEDATVVYMDSVFFSDQILNTVARNLSRAKNMRKIIMIMKGLPPNPWFELERTERMKMSWSPRFGSDVLFYKRTDAPAG